MDREHLRQLETVLCSIFNLIKSLRIHMLLNIDCLRETIRVCFAITKKQVNCVSEVLDAAHLQEFACWAPTSLDDGLPNLFFDPGRGIGKTRSAPGLDNVVKKVVLVHALFCTNFVRQVLYCQACVAEVLYLAGLSKLFVIAPGHHPRCKGEIEEQLVKDICQSFVIPCNPAISLGEPSELELEVVRKSRRGKLGR